MKHMLIAVAALALPAAAWGQATTPPAPAQAPALPYGAPISLARAQAIANAAVAAASARGFRMAVAIVEPSGEPVLFVRMDDTAYGSNHVAQRKAASAARYRQPTAALEQRTLAGRTVTLANEDMLPIAGGVPIVIGGKIVGAIGVSGAAAAEDDEIAHAALEVLR